MEIGKDIDTGAERQSWDGEYLCDNVFRFLDEIDRLRRLIAWGGPEALANEGAAIEAAGTTPREPPQPKVAVVDGGPPWKSFLPTYTFSTSKGTLRGPFVGEHFGGSILAKLTVKPD